MRILLTNDDGYLAEGINNLYHALKGHGHEVTIVAPKTERSTSGHGLTLSKPYFSEQVEENIYWVDGLPADCVLHSLGHLFQGNPPDLIISGINHGANLGQDLYYSGTVAAAREGTFHGVKSIALSQDKDQGQKGWNFNYCSKFVCELINDNKVIDSIDKGTLLNINFPFHETQHVEYTKLGFRFYSSEVDKRTSERNLDYYWLVAKLQHVSGERDTDTRAITDGKISISHHDLLNRGVIDFSQMKEIFDK